MLILYVSVRLVWLKDLPYILGTFHFQHACSFIPRQDIFSSSQFILIREQEMSFLKLIPVLLLPSTEEKVASWLERMKTVF